ncbi:MAG: cobalamin-dependent protein [Desulfobacterales bacterium]
MQIKQRIEQFIRKEGRRPRVLVSNMAKRSPDKDINLLASLFAETGFDVDISPLHQTPRGTARMAIENDVHLICFLSNENNHKKLVTDLVKDLKAENAENIGIVIGGNIPQSDYDFLYGAGVDQILNSALIDAASVNRLFDLFG